jgi:[protein-PII] uridylyltransferase
MGMDDEAVELVALLVRRHLLLVQTATTRDIEDPHTVSEITAHVPTQRALNLLSALTEADARATSAKAWTSWRAGLVRGLSARVAAELGGGTPHLLPGEDEVAVGVRVTAKRRRTLRAHPDEVEVVVEPGAGGALITVVAMDRIGLLADVAAGLALMRIPVRAARAWSVDDWGCSQWQVADEAVDPAVLRQRIEAVVSRAVDPAARLRPTSPDGLEPVVVIHPDASRRATVLEIRAADRPGVLHAVFRVLAELDIGVVSAHVDTVGPQLVDVFYLHEAGAQALGERRAADAAHAVRSALTGGGAETHSRGSSAG